MVAVVVVVVVVVVFVVFVVGVVVRMLGSECRDLDCKV